MSELAVTARSKTEQASPERVKVLVVDDDRDNLLALQAVLEPLQQELILVQSGAEALRLCLHHSFAAILLDIRMADMDGFETAELIRARKVSRHTPIIFLTAYRSDEQLFHGYHLGAVDFLFKPIVPEILQSKVGVFVELSRSEQRLRGQAQELARAEQRFRSVLEAAPDAMVITDEAGTIELVNSQTDSLFGYVREALIGRNVSLLIPQWECPKLREGLPEVPARAETRQTALRRDGTSFPAQITLSPFRSSDATLVTTAIRDATDQVNEEDRILKLNLELEKRVVERTLALTQSNGALKQFAWAASHDLQEPIRCVLAYTQWLARETQGALGERQTHMLEVIEQQALRLHELLAGLRTYIQVSESAEQEWIDVDCNVAVEKAVSGLQVMIDESGASVEIEKLPARISSIEVLLVLLFQNLISNAIKYRSTHQPPVVKISATAEGDDWVFSVSDNGVGIDRKYFDYIFGVFRRLHGPNHSGTGIGLAICKAAVERLGGRLWVESVVGSGSTFHFAIKDGPP